MKFTNQKFRISQNRRPTMFKKMKRKEEKMVVPLYLQWQYQNNI